MANNYLWPSVRCEVIPGQDYSALHPGKTLTPEVRRLLTPGTGGRAGTGLCFICPRQHCTVTRQHAAQEANVSRKCIVSRLPALIVCGVIAFCDILPTSTHHTSLWRSEDAAWRMNIKQGHFNFEEIRFWLPYNVMMGFQLIFRMGFKVYYHVPMLHPPRSYEFLVGSGQNFTTWKEELPAVNVKFIIWPISH